MVTVFRSYSPSDSLRSDRSAGDRQRHRQKVREAIRDGIADIVSEESIIGRGRDRVIKVPLRGIREYRFVYGENTPGVGAGDGDSQPGQVIGQADSGLPATGPGGDRPGVDYYETDITLDELIDIMFEDLELPDLERKKLNRISSERISKRKGYRRVGVRAHLDKRRTAISRIRRRLASESSGPESEERRRPRFPFHRDDIRFRRLRHDRCPQSNAVVICIMDTSGSMDTVKKYLARSFFFLLYQFVRTRYVKVEVVFVAHDTRAQEVSEEEFFHKGESGGTLISSGYLKALEIIHSRFHPTLWNVYAFHCSDGDNFPHDTPAAMKAATELCAVSNLFGYGEIKPMSSSHYSGSLLENFNKVDAPNFETLSIKDKSDIWPSFKQFLTRESSGAREAQ